MFIRFKKKVTLDICAYHDELHRWGSGKREEFEEGEDTEVNLLREKEDALDIEFPDGGVAFDLPKADVEVFPIDVIEGSMILKGILPWPWKARPRTDARSGEVQWGVAQKRQLDDGTILGPGECDTVMGSEVQLGEPEAKLIAKAPEMYVLLRQLLAGQPVIGEVGRLINELELSMEKSKKKGTKR